MFLNVSYRTIGPIGYEDRNVTKIRQAFARGCSGVLVDGNVPQAVTSEVEALSSECRWPVDGDDRIKISCYGPERSTWHSTNHRYAVPETREWVSDHMQWAHDGGLRRPFSELASGQSNDMVIFLRGSVARSWHTDISHPQYPDIHIHGYGEGMVVAVPKAPVEISFDDRKPDNIALPGLSFLTREQQQLKLDEYLVDKGFEFVTMKPGQVLIFGRNVIHQSSSTPSDQMKMRAALFRVQAPNAPF